MQAESSGSAEEKANVDRQAEYYSACLNAWIQTRMEKDKTLLSLAAGGIGLNVTLIAWADQWGVGALFGVCAGVLFLLSIRGLLRILGMNADHLECVIKESPSEHAKPLERLDRRVDCLFLAACLITLLSAIVPLVIRFIANLVEAKR